MDHETMTPVVETPDHAAALALVTESAAPASEPAPSVVAAVPPESTAPKRKGGFPKGMKRDARGRIVRDPNAPPASSSRSRRRAAQAAVGDAVTAPAVPAGKVYTAAELGPLTGAVQDGPAPGSSGLVPAPADPALVAYVRPRVDLMLRGITMILARITKKPDAVATDQERELMGEAISYELCAKLPEIAAKAGEMGIAAAVLPYGVRLLELFGPSMGGASGSGGVPATANSSGAAPASTPAAPAVASAPAVSPLPSDAARAVYGGPPI